MTAWNNFKALNDDRILIFLKLHVLLSADDID